MVAGLVLDLAYAAIVAWFWVHCARPTLIAAGASPSTCRVVLGATLLTMVGASIHLATLLAHTEVQAGYWVRTGSSVIYGLIVGLGYLNRYRLIIQATDELAIRGGRGRLREPDQSSS